MIVDGGCRNPEHYLAGLRLGSRKIGGELQLVARAVTDGQDRSHGDGRRSIMEVRG
jgi:hypothetical protein